MSSKALKREGLVEHPFSYILKQYKSLIGKICFGLNEVDKVVKEILNDKDTLKTAILIKRQYEKMASKTSNDILDIFTEKGSELVKDLRLEEFEEAKVSKGVVFDFPCFGEKVKGRLGTENGYL